MSPETHINEIITNQHIYVLIDHDDNLAQIESEETEQSDGSPCMVQLLFTDEWHCKSLTNIQFTKYNPVSMSIEELLEFLLAIDEVGWLVMINPNADMNDTEHEPIELYNQLGVALWLFE